MSPLSPADHVMSAASPAVKFPSCRRPATTPCSIGLKQSFRPFCFLPATQSAGKAPSPPLIHLSYQEPQALSTPQAPSPLCTLRLWPQAPAATTFRLLGCVSILKISFSEGTWEWKLECGARQGLFCTCEEAPAFWVAVFSRPGQGRVEARRVWTGSALLLRAAAARAGAGAPRVTY